MSITSTSIIYNKIIIYIIMDSPRNVIRFMNENFYLFEKQYEDVDKNVLKAAIAYKYLLATYLHIKNVTIEQILIENDYDIGLIGPGHSCLTSICEKICPNRVCHLHSILHDVYGRIFLKYNQGRGYFYMFKAPNWMKKCPLFGHITGLMYSIYYNIRYYHEYQT